MNFELYVQTSMRDWFSPDFSSIRLPLLPSWSSYGRD